MDGVGHASGVSFSGKSAMARGVRGRVVRVSAKPETPGEPGLPKREVASATVTAAGVAGDFNGYRHRKKADDPAQAVLVVPVETLGALAAEGWPVAPGDLGENLTTQGVPYDALAIGRRYRAGSVLIEISKVCEPCTTLHALPYVGEARGPEFVKTMVGRRGMYARVIEPGTVAPGDAFEAA